VLTYAEIDRRLNRMANALRSRGVGAHWQVADRDRAKRLAENIDICRRLWREDTQRSRGPTDRSRGDRGPRPLQQPCPIWIASNPGRSTATSALVERALRRVAEKADGWMTVQLSAEWWPGAGRRS
jgi:alkanesulfonate monooxygenase SsuD/methylene tetrahydromethanopterin reductase-like flavin-dependent oxidoreductase (luciferase family)